LLPLLAVLIAYRRGLQRLSAVRVAAYDALRRHHNGLHVSVIAAVILSA
jgi:hypothetical protein